MKKILLIACCLLITGYTHAQQKNIIKLSIGDCVNCVSSLSHILEKDSAVTFLVKGDYAVDSLDVLEKFDLTDYRRQFIWNTRLYDSLSREPESELIQFCGDQELNRCGLRKLHYLTITGCDGKK